MKSKHFATIYGIVYVENQLGSAIMIKQGVSAVSRNLESVLSTNKVLRNTYILLATTFLFSAIMAFISVTSGVTTINPLFFILGADGLMFLTHALQNSPWGIAAVFAFTGFMGYALGPVLNACIAQFHNGPQIIATSFGGTGIIFFGLSAYALVTRKNFTYLAGFLFAAMMVAQCLRYS